jgi:hypothetical protein
MNRIDCENEKDYKRSIGLALLPLAVALGLIGSLTLPVAGAVASILLLVLAVIFLMAPERKACKTLRRRDE